MRAPLLLGCTLLATTAALATVPAMTTTQLFERLLAPSVATGTQVTVRRVAGLPAGCAPISATPLSPVDRSGPVVVDVADDGGHCNARVVVDVRVERPVLVVKAAVATGAPLAGAVAVELRDVPPHQRAMTSLPAGAVARRPVVVGRVLADDDVALPGPATGEAVKVVLRSGGLRLVRIAVAMPCAGHVDRRHHCARLPNGRQVHGVFTDGVIELEETP
jgi:flagella basal body P-ring formation protein FlgA